MERLSSLVYDVFFRKSKYFQVKVWLFLTFDNVNIDINTKRKFYIYGYNVLGHFDILPNISFTTSETERDYY